MSSKYNQNQIKMTSIDNQNHIKFASNWQQIGIKKSTLTFRCLDQCLRQLLQVINLSLGHKWELYYKSDLDHNVHLRCVQRWTLHCRLRCTYVVHTLYSGDAVYWLKTSLVKSLFGCSAQLCDHVMFHVMFNVVQTLYRRCTAAFARAELPYTFMLSLQFYQFLL